MATRAERQNFQVVELATKAPVGEMLMLAERQRDELTIGEAAALLGYSKKTVCNLICEGKLIRIKRGRVSRKSVIMYREM